MIDAPRLLIVTAAFGEGHNSAARNLALALESAGAVTTVKDPCLLALPTLTAVVNRVYRFVTMRLPRLWKWIYRYAGQYDYHTGKSPLLRKIEATLAGLVHEFKPDAVVSTYPLYPYFLPGLLRGSPRKVPVVMVVTDSIEINPAWMRAKCDAWLLTDSHTREVMVRGGVPADRLVETGFPVHPDFSKLTPLSVADSCQPFRVLYFPMANANSLSDQAMVLLRAHPTVHLTVVLGRNVRLLYRSAHEVKSAFPGRVRIVGWTRRIPRLFNSHHLVVGKAGGATVHEAIAACCPMLIHHLVPGQEEGNLELLRRIGGGGLADSPAALGRAMTDLLADHASGWRAMKSALARHGRNAGALAAAKYVLGTLNIEHRTPNIEHRSEVFSFPMTDDH